MSTGWQGITGADGQDPLRSVMADADELGSYSNALHSVVGDIDRLVEKMVWRGEDRVAFEMNWRNEKRPELEEAAKLMRAKNSELTALAAAQARASRLA